MTGRDIWGLDDGAWVALESIRVDCDNGYWYVEFAEDEHGNELSESDREQLRDMNTGKFNQLVFEKSRQILKTEQWMAMDYGNKN